jgi:hypothetical protein
VSIENEPVLEPAKPIPDNPLKETEVPNGWTSATRRESIGSTT